MGINNQALGFTITQEEFLRSAKTFIEKSDKLYDGWEMAESNGVQFIKLVTQRRISMNSEISKGKQTEPKLEFEQIMDSEILPGSASMDYNISDIMFLEYHVIYSISYCVPVLYLRGFDSAGSALRVDKLILNGQFCGAHQTPGKDNHVLDQGIVQEIGDIGDIPEYLSTETSFVRPDTFSQAPHPLLFEPFYQLHPCHTSQWMKMMYAVNNAEKGSEKRVHLSVENYIIIWLSFVGPYIGLSLDNKYMLI